MFNSSQPSVVVLPSETSVLYTITPSVITIHRVYNSRFHHQEMNIPLAESFLHCMAKCEFLQDITLYIGTHFSMKPPMAKHQ